MRMEFSLHAPLVFVVLLWATYFGELYRTARTGKLKTKFARLIWFAGFLGVLVITFSGQRTEHVLDSFFGNQPIVFYTKFVCALLIIHVLYLLFRQTMRPSRFKDQVFLHASLGTIIVGLLTMPVFMQLSPLVREQMRYGLLALRDVVVCSYMIVIFIPATYVLWKTETILPTRIKHFAGILFDISYLLLGLGNILTFIAALFSLEAAVVIDAAFRPVMALCAFFFTVAISSNFVLTKVLWVQQRFLLWRLRRLERRVVEIVGVPLREVSVQQIDDRIYRTVISILDHYRKLCPQTHPDLYERIDQAVQGKLDYLRLVEDLAKLA